MAPRWEYESIVAKEIGPIPPGSGQRYPYPWYWGGKDIIRYELREEVTKGRAADDFIPRKIRRRKGTALQAHKITKVQRQVKDKDGTMKRIEELSKKSKEWVKHLWGNGVGIHDQLECFINPKYRRQDFLDNREEMARGYLEEIDVAVTGGFLKSMTTTPEGTSTIEIVWENPWKTNRFRYVRFMDCGAVTESRIWDLTIDKPAWPYTPVWTDYLTTPVYHRDRINVKAQEVKEKRFRFGFKTKINTEIARSEQRMKDMVAHEYAHMLSDIFLPWHGDPSPDGHTSNWRLV
ncbi:hypothetical protein ABW19_dt0205253 [Dactylella cylindrospora]|nr:hypothetical protein ABW19_dt0205253 [Dactylella cylindrospora]